MKGYGENQATGNQAAFRVDKKFKGHTFYPRWLKRAWKRRIPNELDDTNDSSLDSNPYHIS
jgi:hypothetical protein